MLISVTSSSRGIQPFVLGQREMTGQPVKVYLIGWVKGRIQDEELAFAAEKSWLKLDEPEDRERRLIRKVDFRLLPILGALYAISVVDKTNVSWPFSHAGDRW